MSVATEAAEAAVAIAAAATDTVGLAGTGLSINFSDTFFQVNILFARVFIIFGKRCRKGGKERKNFLQIPVDR
jgi:hypothetical protein